MVDRGLIPALTGVRGFAAAWVVLFHFRRLLFSLLPEVQSETLERFAGSGHAGVELFFVLSGFVLAYNYLHAFPDLSARRIADFLARRVARIYPLHLATTLVCIPMVLPGGIEQLRPGQLQSLGPDLWQQLLLVHAWTLGPPRAWNYPSWSISSEWFAYLFFPAVAFFYSRIRGIVTPLLMSVVAWVVGAVLHVYLSTSGHAEWFLVSRIPGPFMVGVATYVIFSKANESAAGRRGAPITWVGLGLALAVTIGLDPVGRVGSIAAIPFYGLFLLGLALERSRLALFLSHRVNVRLGEASYALYMTHALVQAVAGKLGLAEMFEGSALVVRIAIVALLVVVLQLVALVAHDVLERPARKYFMSGFTMLQRRVLRRGLPR